ncbi:MAG: HlyD family secretion protein [Acidobacteria bacterium]|nr:HlyD family secretion protein [Acidobacteriota bacterium]
MKRNWKIIAASAAVVAIALGSMAFLSLQGRETTDNAQVDGNLVPVASKVYGNVARVAVDDNQAVKAGDVLVEIDARDYEVKVQQARAALALAESQSAAAAVSVPLTAETTSSNTAGAQAQLQSAEAELLRAQVNLEQSAGSELAYAKANVAAMKANNEKAQADLERMGPLAEKQEISRQQYDAYVAAARVAESQLQAAKEKLDSAGKDAENKRAAILAARARVEQSKAAVSQAKAGQKQVSVRTAEAQSALASIEQAKANLAYAELQLSYTKIKAPVAGVVTRKSVEQGQILQPGQGLLMLIPLQGTWVTANFKETQLRDVRPGQRAEIEVDMLGRKVTGRVDSVAGATGARMSLLPPENATGNFVKVVQRVPVKIVLDKLPEGMVLRPGLNVEATIVTR